MPIDEHDHLVEQIPAIRKLIKDAFNTGTLREFCQDHSEFRPLLARFGENPSLDGMTEKVIEHCRTQVLFGELLAGIESHSPRQYGRHYAAIYGGERITHRARREDRRQPEFRDALLGFVDRGDEIALFRQMLAGETPQRILLMLERAEQGKTYLLLRLFHECEGHEPPAPAVLLDFDERRSGLNDYVGVAREVRRHLGDERTPAICACERTMAELGGERTEREQEALGRALRDDLAALGRAVLLVDTFERAPEETCRWLERWLFDPLRRELLEVLAVVAGRPECRGFFDQPRLWSGLIAAIERFDSLSKDDVLAHYRQRGLDVSEAETSLLMLAQSSPARMAQLGDLLQQVRGGKR